MIARISKYTIEKELGHGGFGDVFLAFDPDTGQKVAIKHLRVELGLDPEMLKRFQHEIRTTASLRHRNIVTIHASGVEDGNPYLVMEFLEGRTLKDIIQERQPLSLLEKVGIMTQVAEGLAYAHSKGIVHRDVKPENIMLLPDDSVKIMDFGIALAPDRHTVMTETGGIIGTPPYFAPEQLEGYKANEQTDIFSLGDVYYELLTGQHPFERFKHDWKALQMAILSFDPPAVSQMAAGCPEALELLVHRMIAKEREFRYGTFEELLLDSKAVLVDLQRERAGALLREVPPLVETGDLQTALGILREAQQLDPGNREARQLRDTITQKLQRSVVQGRVNELLSEAEGLVGERRFGEAVQSLESAARLDSSNVTVQVRLGEAKARLDSSARASRLVSEARLKQQKGQLTDALERLTAALAIDPDHTEALALSPRMRELVERRERDSRREQALQKAGGHLGAKRYSEALAVLEQIEQEQPGAAEVAQLRERIEQAKEHERVRRAERFNLAVTRTREAMQAGELERAGQMLDHLLANFAEEPGAAGVLPALREQLNAQMRAQQIGACRAEARDLLQKKAYGEALGLLGEALRRFPGDTGLERLQRSAEELYRAQQHSEAIAAVMREAGEKRDAGDFRGALEVVSAARTRIGEEAGLVELARQLEMEIEQQRYAAGLEELLHASRQLIAGGKYSQAIEGITRAPEYGGEAEVRALLESARVSEAIAEERRVVAEALVAAEGLSTRGDWAAALGPVEQALGRYPHDPGLKQSAERLREQMARERRRGAIERHRATIRHEIEGGAWKRAEAALLRARSEFPNESAFEELAKQVEAGLFNARLDEVASGVREKLAAGNIPEALENIEATRTVFAHDTRWKSLAEEVARRRAYEAALVEAERHRKEGDLSTAVTLLTRVICEGPADERAIQTIAAIQAERSEAAKRAETAEIAEMAARVRERLARDDIQQASGELDKARAKYPEASLWATLKSEIDARQKLLVRQAEIPALAESVRNCLQREDVRRAAAELAAARAKYSGEGLWATLQAEIDERQELLRQRTEVLQLEESIRGCMKRDHLRQAAGELDAARAKYPSEGRWVTLAADISARQVWLSRQAEVAAIAESIRGCLKRDDLRQAVAELGAARAKYPDESLWAALEVEISARQVWLNRQAEVAAIGENIRGCLKRDDLRQAVAELSAARTKYPSEGLWVELQGEADARQALLNRQAEVAAIGESIRGCLKRDDLRQAVAELGAARAKYPGESLWATLEEIIARQTLLKRQAEIAAIVESIRRCLKRENVRQAVADLGAARAKYPGESLWAELQVEVDARQALLKRQAEIAAMAESIRGCLKRDDLRQAAAELGAARTKYPGENLWATLEAEISARQALLKRQTEIAAMAESIRGCLKRDDLRQAAAELGTARTKYPGENLWATLEVEIGARQALLKRQAEIAAVAESIRGSLKRDDLRQAAAELGTARTRYPGENLLATLEAEINARQSALETIEQERRRREQDLHEAQRNAEALLAQGRPEEAIALLEGRFGGEPVVRELIARARGDLDRRRRENDRARLLAIEQQVESAPPKRKVRELDAEAQGIAARHAPDEEFAQIASRIHARAVAVLETPTPKKPLPWKLVGGCAAAAALVAALVLVPKLFHKNAPTASPVENVNSKTAVEIRTDPLGASVRVGDRSCVTPNCRFDLAPGQYQVQAEMKGFQPAAKTVTIDMSKGPTRVDLTLAPLSPPPPPPGATGKLAVLAGQAGVLVVVDKVARGQTGADGRLNLLLEAKTHDVRVEKDRYQPASRQVQIVRDSSQQVEFTLLPKEAKIELLGAPAGVELRVGNKLLGRTDGSADFPFPETVVPGRETLLVSEGGASWPYPHEFQPEETLKLPWKDVAASRPQNVKPPINQPANPPAAEEDDPSVPLYATLTWRSRLEDGETVVINGRVLIPNHLAGIQLPGLPVTVSATTPGVTVIQQPSPGDQWSTFAIRNDSKRPLDMIRLRWQRIRQK